jgi:spore germination protein KB
MKLDKPTINNNQFRALLVCVTWPTAINYASGMLARQVGRDMWISGAISVLSTLIFVFIIIGIGRSFPGKTIVEYSQELLWTIPGKLLGLLLTAYFLVAAVNTVSMYIHHLTDFLLPETPFLVVTVIHVAVVTYLVWKGPEVISRMSVIGFVLAILFYFLVFLASLSEVDFSRLMPLFESGALAVYKSSFSVDSFIGIIPIIIAMILPMVLNQKKAFGTAASGVCIGGGFFVFYFIVELMVMGPQVVALMRIASMDFVRSIQITQYLHRFESFMVALWYWSMLVHAGILAYCSLKAFFQTVGIKKEKTKSVLVIFYGIAIVILTYYIANDRIFFLNFREKGWKYFALPIQYGLPALLLLALGIKKAFHGSNKK